ncbi:MAG: enoyl-CoA hydratase/isomerase family protein [Cypionkella sp.]
MSITQTLVVADGAAFRQARAQGRQRELGEAQSALGGADFRGLTDVAGEDDDVLHFGAPYPLRLARPNPLDSRNNGFCIGGGVGVACHASHRVAVENAQIGMPECPLGLVPDVGGTQLLARAPGRLGALLGVTEARMGPADAIFAGFVDVHIPRAA